MFLLLILPILVSGFLVCHIHPFYRDKGTLEVHFTKHYANSDANAVTIIKQDLISSACAFSFATYEKLHRKG
ncbi:hypothetical protein [Vibrio campbellii]